MKKRALFACISGIILFLCACSPSGISGAAENSITFADYNQSHDEDGLKAVPDDVRQESWTYDKIIEETGFDICANVKLPDGFSWASAASYDVTLLDDGTLLGCVRLYALHEADENRRIDICINADRDFITDIGKYVADFEINSVFDGLEYASGRKDVYFGAFDNDDTYIAQRLFSAIRRDEQYIFIQAIDVSQEEYIDTLYSFLGSKP